MSNTREHSYSIQATDFVDEVMYPSEALANIFIKASEGIFLPNIPKGQLEDIGVVCAALTAHAKHRLHDAFGKIEGKTGKIEVIQQCRETAHTEAIDVTVEGQSSTSCHQ